MISKFWDALIDYADKMKNEKRMRELEIVRDIEDILQDAYDNGNKYSSTIDKEPENEIEKIVLSIPDIKVFLDSTDDTYFYELDGWHFDYPYEVIQYLIEARDTYRTRVAANARKDVLKAIYKMISSRKVGTIINDKTSVEIEDRKKHEEKCDAWEVEE